MGIKMLSWIPLLGPIIQGISSIFNGFFNKEIAVVQANASTEIAATQASVQIIQATNDDILLRIIRDLMILPGAAWFAIGGWDTIIARHYPWMKFGVSEFPPQLEYYPYAVLVFLLGNIGVNAWKHR